MIPIKQFDTIEEAVKEFILEIPEHKHTGLKELVRRYEVAGRLGTMTITFGPRNCFPRFKWIGYPPPAYAGVDMTDAVKAFLRPYGAPNVPPKQKPARQPEKPIALEFGVLVHETDFNHYSNLLERLQTKQQQLFPEGQEEDEDEL